MTSILAPYMPCRPHGAVRVVHASTHEIETECCFREGEWDSRLYLGECEHAWPDWFDHCERVHGSIERWQRRNDVPRCPATVATCSSGDVSMGGYQ